MESFELYTSALTVDDEDLRNKTVVMIDVLRASTTIVTALENGAAKIIPVEDMGAAGRLNHGPGAPQNLLAGEKDGRKMEGYDMGNSPLEYTPDKVTGKTIILNTTNGTKALKRAGLASRVYVGCFRNLSAVVNALRTAENGVVLLCAGWRGRLSMEDLLCAGNIIYELNGGETDTGARDGIRLAASLHAKYGSDIEGAVQTSDHARRLKGIVEGEDISFCCSVDATDVLPVLHDGIISNSHG